MQYAKMVDLIEEAEIAGEARTEFVNERLSDALDRWLSEQDLGEITEEEEDALRKAFEKGWHLRPQPGVACLPTIHPAERGGWEQANCLRKECEQDIYQ